MAIDDLEGRSFALPVRLVNTVIFNAADPVTTLTEAASYGLKLIDDRFFNESSQKIFEELESYLKTRNYHYDGYGVYEVVMSRRSLIILRTDAKEFSKSSDEFLTLCLVQYLTR